jgi:hypothetical protein
MDNISKYGANVKVVNEYLTTKTCSQCGQINELGPSKIHSCKCGMVSGRDENAAKNILKVGYDNRPLHYKKQEKKAKEKPLKKFQRKSPNKIPKKVVKKTFKKLTKRIVNSQEIVDV